MHEGEALKKLMDKEGISAYDLAPLLGYQPPAVYSMFKRREIKPILKEKIYDLISEISKRKIPVPNARDNVVLLYRTVNEVKELRKEVAELREIMQVILKRKK